MNSKTIHQEKEKKIHFKSKHSTRKKSMSFVKASIISKSVLKKNPNLLAYQACEKSLLQKIDISKHVIPWHRIEQ